MLPQRTNGQLQINEPGHSLSNKVAFALSEDQPAHTRRQTRVFTVRLEAIWILGYPFKSVLNNRKCADFVVNCLWFLAYLSQRRRMNYCDNLPSVDHLSVCPSTLLNDLFSENPSCEAFCQREIENLTNSHGPLINMAAVLIWRKHT